MTDHSKFILKDFYRIEGFRIFFPRENPTFANPGFNEASLKVLIVRLSPLQNIRESITHHFLFQEIRRALPSAYIDYAFFPSPKNIRLFTENKISFFIGIQSLCSISDFDLVLISNSFPLELFNLPFLFFNTGIPALKSQRTRRPIVIMGGSNILMSQCCISPDGDSFIDALFFGEGESSVGKIAAIVNDNSEKPKSEVLKILEKDVNGVFDIRLPIPDHICVTSLKIPDPSYILTDFPILNTDIENTVKIEITRGCPCFCSFCFEGNTRKPFIEYDHEDILSKALEVKIKHAPVEFDLLSFNFNLHTGISKIIAGLNGISKFVNFKSQRADILAMHPELLDMEILSGKRTYTIGVEGINDRMRRFLHKSLTEGELLGSLMQIYSRKPRQLKLSYIITGLENENDRKEFKEFIMKLKRLRNELSPGCRTILSFGLLSILPFTPLQFSPTIKDPESIRQIKGDIKRDCETNNFEFRMAQDFEEFLISQHIVLAGFECFEVISGFAGKGGYFDGEHIIGDRNALISALGNASGGDIYASKDDHVFPFEQIKGTPDKKFLSKMHNDAKNFKDNGYCLEGKGDCIGCGGCQEREILVPPSVKREDLEKLKVLVEKKKKPEIVRVEIIIKEQGRFLTPEAKCAFIGRAVLMQMPSLAHNYLSCRIVQNMPGSKGYGFLFGRFLYDFEFTGNSESFSKYLKTNAIDTPILGISSKSGEVGTIFRITALWSDTSKYGFQNRLQEYFFSKGLAFDVRKQERSIYFEVAGKDKKKKLINSLVFQQEDDRVVLEADTGQNFLIIDILKSLFGEAWFDAKVESI